MYVDYVAKSQVANWRASSRSISGQRCGGPGDEMFDGRCPAPNNGDPYLLYLSLGSDWVRRSSRRAHVGSAVEFCRAAERLLAPRIDAATMAAPARAGPSARRDVRRGIGGRVLLGGGRGGVGPVPRQARGATMGGVDDLPRQSRKEINRLVRLVLVHYTVDV